MLKIIIAIAVIVMFLIFVPFLRDMMMVKKDLAKNPIESKFNTFFETINEELMNGNGELTLFDDDPRAANIQDPKSINTVLLRGRKSDRHTKLYVFLARTEMAKNIL